MKLSIEKDLQRVVDMYWNAEKKDWEYKGADNDRHIFLSLNNIKNWLIGYRKNKGEQNG